MTTEEAVARGIAFYEEMGCEDWSKRFGFVRMPTGYRCFLNADRSHFFGLRLSDGMETCIHWNPWAIYRWAVADTKEND